MIDFESELLSLEKKTKKEDSSRDFLKIWSVRRTFHISIGTSLLGAFMGRRTSSLARGIGRSMKERKDVQYAKESLESLNQQLLNVQSEFDSELTSLNTKTNQQDVLETVLFKPNKNEISVKLLSLVWYPSGRDSFSK